MKIREQGEAVRLRKSGASIKQIARELRVSPSSASRWCEDVRLSPFLRKQIADRGKAAGFAALRPWIEKNRALKRADLKEQLKLGNSDVGETSNRDLFMLGLGLYWGEGYKRGNQECGFTNSDPAIIRTILLWFEKCYGVSKNRIIARLTINTIYAAHTQRITRMWARETNIPLSSFGKPSFITGYGSPERDPSTYRGTLRVKIRSGTSLRRRILAGIAKASAH